MNKTLSIHKRNAVLNSMKELVKEHAQTILDANKIDMDSYDDSDLAMSDRLKVNDAKIEGMIESLRQLAELEDPVGVERFSFTHDNGMQIYNRTASFGTVMIIYESRPDVTIEAGGIAFKSGNKILLKGGKESLNSNLAIVDLWHKALQDNDVSTEWVEYLNYNRTETQAFLENPTQTLDLIVPRGGERLIEFVKQNAKCPVIVSGRGNNFVYVHKHADVAMALDIIVNAKTQKVSGCNAVDKVLIDNDLPNKAQFIEDLLERLASHNVEVLGDDSLANYKTVKQIENDDIWYKEFLDYKIVIGSIPHTLAAIEMINKYSGGHSASIVTSAQGAAENFMASVDCGAVYHNASTRFTDGFEFGLGGELAISTDKLHQRGPIGLQHLVTNKWYVHGNGQIR
ncbi:glutamate-5-semialdehyde dehydrogenase [Algibacter amylolyticus]|uniref:Gamma-glutamyl phosphate reductase n=1 Tax=Algibacter amylolyticus TaxID=1608400 RepID=A0A5M7BCG8_9FLAO|nr:glutamate-5-semialdehyde dehydrogenase [Algibacter amylolyticus]KAA5826360.1 glutamate-5-semialdehyde dehydrogenase [Algibacter amylolyticus]MBB5268565.1 glutamate-5-semialdehyde dehydrogenase [Algibacter amylolyticus]TSJ80398.1 glutamate-5-semialdehyde dehydrogenase [Algibacter amylolyticus]